MSTNPVQSQPYPQSYYSDRQPSSPEQNTEILLNALAERLRTTTRTPDSRADLRADLTYCKQALCVLNTNLQGLRAEIAGLKEASEPSSVACSIFRFICIVITILALAALVVLALTACGIIPGLGSIIMGSAIGAAFGANTFVALCSICAGIALVGGIGFFLSGKRPLCC